MYQMNATTEHLNLEILIVQSLEIWITKIWEPENDLAGRELSGHRLLSRCDDL